MKTQTVFAVLCLAIAVGGSHSVAAQIIETRLESGDSEIRVTEAGKELASYRINLSRHHHPATSADDPLIKAWEKWKFGAFVCFNSNQFDGREIDRSKDPKIYDPPVVDVKQWISTFKAAGMDYAVLTVRHTSGFLLWDSPTSQHDVGRSGNPTDVVKLYVEECRRQRVQPGIYYCLWGGKFNRNPNGRAVILAQLHELATWYGDIPFFWIDMMNWAPGDLTAQEIYDSLKNVHPKTVVMFNQHIQDGRQIKYFPTDVLNGEMRLPPAEGHNPIRQVNSKTYYLPLEYEPCSQRRGTHRKLGGWDYGHASWFTYGAGRKFDPSHPFPPAFLHQWICRAYDCGAANVLLSCAPDHTGRIRDEDVRQLVELGRMLKDPSLAPPRPLAAGGKATASGIWPEPRLGPELAFDDDPNTRWGGAPNSTSGWLAIDLGKPKQFRRIRIREGWDRVRKFEVQVERGKAWETIHAGTTIGDDFSAEFQPVTAQHVRLNILEAADVPTIWEVELLDK